MRPAHTQYDGDTIFTMATGEEEVDINVVGLLSARVMEQAVLRAVMTPASLAGFKCYADLHK
jgi:L-aminopeptidase/D-esterase-like protein